MLNTANATIETGMPSVYQAHRQPSGPPAQVAMPATRIGLAMPVTWVARLVIAAMRARIPMG